MMGLAPVKHRRKDAMIYMEWVQMNPHAPPLATPLVKGERTSQQPNKPEQNETKKNQNCVYNIDTSQKI